MNPSTSLPVRPSYNTETPDNVFAHEVYRGLKMIMSGIGMIIAAWARRYALEKLEKKD